MVEYKFNIEMYKIMMKPVRSGVMPRLWYVSHIKYQYSAFYWVELGAGKRSLQNAFCGLGADML